MKNFFTIPRYQLYLLQLENYELTRFWRLLFARGLWQKGDLRKQLVWTEKAKIVFGLSAVLYAGLSLTPFLFFRGNGFLPTAAGFVLVLMVSLMVLFFLPLTIASWLLWPVDRFAKARLVARAKTYLKNHQDHVTVIGIAGSYGKTTMKHMLTEVLKKKFRVIATPESVNTPVGISRWLLEELGQDTQVIVVEFGEHYQGDVRDLCDLLPPDISVITGINEAHLERMRNMSVTVQTVFEAVAYAKPNAMLVLNADSGPVAAEYAPYTKGRQVHWYSARENAGASLPVSDISFDEQSLRQTFTMCGEHFTLQFLAPYAVGDCMAAVMIGQRFGMTTAEIAIAAARVAPVVHRLQPIVNPAGLVVIDDSYNGNPDGVAEAIAVLSKFISRRKIYITPGLVEIGARTEAVHKEIGRRLAEVADVVMLVRNSVTPFIERGIHDGLEQRPGAENTARRPEILWYSTAQAAHEALKDIVKPGDVILFQNDWGDNYL